MVCGGWLCGVLEEKLLDVGQEVVECFDEVVDCDFEWGGLLMGWGVV